MVGDGNNVPITHIGFTALKSCDSTFKLNNVLCAPNIKKNLLSVSQFCTHNNTSIEFFPDFFLVKDLTTGASLVRGWSRGNVYEWPTATSPSPVPRSSSSSQHSAFTTTMSSPPYQSISFWHNRLGHPSSKILHQIVASHNLPLSKSSSSSTSCNACLCNKSHKLPFGVSSLNCSRPLEILFMDV